MDAADRQWMARALALAERGRGRVEPNPLVGAVVVAGVSIVGEGWHQVYGGPHAEIHALDAAGAAARGATLYVTLEPCCHQGQTPPCTDAVLRSGIARVVAAMTDPNPLVAGHGVAVLRGARLTVDVGLAEAEARRLNAPYRKLRATGRPYVHCKWAMTLDGRIATASRQSRWISGAESRARGHALRGRMDAVVVGIGTVLADDPLLTARPAGPRTPARIVLDTHARLPIDCQLVHTAGDAPVLVAVGEAAPADHLDQLRRLGCQTLALPCRPGGIAVAALLDVLGGRGMTNILVEGGAAVLGSFFDAGEADEVHVFAAPIVVGGAVALAPVGGRGAAALSEGWRPTGSESEQLGADLYVRSWRDPGW